MSQSLNWRVILNLPNKIDDFAEPGTLLILAVMIPFWFLQFAIVLLFGGAAIEFLRVTSSSPSVGWLISPISHGGAFHIVQNSIGLFFIGSAVEKYIKTRYYLLLFVCFSILTNVLAWVYMAHRYSPKPVAGASGAIFAFGAFYFIHSMKAGDIRWEGVPEEGFVASIISIYTTPKWLIWLTGLALIVLGIGMSIADITELINPGKVAHVGHGVGVLLGIFSSYSIQKSWLKS